MGRPSRPRSRRHGQEGQEGRLDDSGMAHDDHELATVSLGDARHRLRRTGHERAPALSPWRHLAVGISVEVGLAVPETELVPGEAVGLAGMQFAQVAVLHRRGTVPDAPGHDARRLERTRQHAGIQRAGAGELARLEESGAQRLGLASPGGGQSGASLGGPRRRLARCRSPRRGG